MVCGESQICHDLVLDQNVNYNAYSIPLRHEAFYMDHKMVILGIGLYHNISLLLCVQHQNYSKHDTLCLYILLYWIFFCILPDQWLHVSEWYLDRYFWNSLARLTSLFCVEECIIIRESDIVDSVNWKLDTNWYIYISLVNCWEKLKTNWNNVYHPY